MATERNAVGAELEQDLDELSEASSLTRGFGMLALLAKTHPIRIFEASGAGRTKVLDLPSGIAGGLATEPQLVAFRDMARLVAEKCGGGGWRQAALAVSGAGIDFTVDPDDCSLRIDVGDENILAGEDLAALVASVDPTGETAPAPGFGPQTVDDGYLTASEAASMLGVAKSTVTRRIEKDEMVGFRMFKNALRVPREQFLDGNVVPGIPEILALFGTDTASAGRIDHKAAWMFLESTIYAGDAEPRPVDRLRAAAGTARTGNAVVELALAKESLDYGNHV